MIRRLLFHLLSTDHDCDKDDVHKEVRKLFAEARQIGRDVFGREPEEPTVRHISAMLHETRKYNQVKDHHEEEPIFRDMTKN